MTTRIDPLCVLKLLVIGESGVGKSSIVQAYSKDTFDEHQTATIGLDFESKTVEVDGSVVKLAIWDTAGQERYRTLVPSFYRDAHGAILVYDVGRPETLSNLDYWLRELMAYSNKTNMVTLLVGNKIDKGNRNSFDMVIAPPGAVIAQRLCGKGNSVLRGIAWKELNICQLKAGSLARGGGVGPRQVDKATGSTFAQRHRMLFIECSALSREGVNLAFEELIRKILETPGLWISYENQSVKLHNVNKDEANTCLGFNCQLI